MLLRVFLSVTQSVSESVSYSVLSLSSRQYLCKQRTKQTAGALSALNFLNLGLTE